MVNRAIVVHGHCAGPRGECLQRIRRAERVSRPTDLIILSGAGEARYMRDTWRGNGRVLVDSASTTTVENVVNAAFLALLFECPRIVAVTSWWHVPRAERIWNRHGLEPVMVAARGSIRHLPREVRLWWETS